MEADLVMTERLALVATLEQLGPDAPTMCAGWTTLDLAAHLVLRERDLVGGPGILLPGPFARLTARRLEAHKQRGWANLLDQLRRQPPLHFRIAPTGVNLTEHVIHHEDARRANGEGPRLLASAVEDELWSWMGRVGRLYVRGVDAGVEARTPDGRSRVLRDRSPRATLTGLPSEIMLYLNGRRSAAEAEVGGDPVAAARLAAADLGV